MTKKCFLVLAFAAVVVSGAFALPEFRVSAGLGGNFSNDFGGGVEVSIAGTRAAHVKTPYIGGGGFVFFDLTFAELSLGFFTANGTIEDHDRATGITLRPGFSGLGLDVGLLGKYPFAVSNRLSLFPLFGVTYRTMLSADIGGVTNDHPGDFRTVWFRFGGGLDFSFTNNTFVRLGALYGFRLENRFEDDTGDRLEYLLGRGSDAESLLGHGFDIRLSFGVRF
jgi:hypothetical protein